MSHRSDKKGVWQDREIRFDVPYSQLQCRDGEFEIDSLNNIEDTKGNNGERGQLIITNLRMIWTESRNYRINLSMYIFSKVYNQVLDIIVF